MASVIAGALYLGAGVGGGNNTPPDIYIAAEGSRTKTAIIGTYDWDYLGKHINSDSVHPTEFEYEDENVISVVGNQQIIIDTRKLKKDKKYDFTLDNILIYKNGNMVKFASPEPNLMNGSLYLQAPPEAGEYVYNVVLNYKNEGTVSYGFVVRVDMLTYDLSEISKYKMPYVGNHMKVLSIAGSLPVPDKYFRQQYISMKTKSKPYKLTVFYEAASDVEYLSEWPIVTPDTVIERNSRANALVVFCMIDNVDEVTFAFRNSKSDGGLEESAYDTAFTFQRASFEEKYGNLSQLGENLDLLRNKLEEENSWIQKPQ
jgi:hypothetical protein